MKDFNMIINSPTVAGHLTNNNKFYIRYVVDD